MPPIPETNDIYSYSRFIQEVYSGNAILVALVDTTVPVSFSIGYNYVQLTSTNSTYDLGYLFYPTDIINSVQLNTLVRTNILSTARGVVRLDSTSKLNT